MKKRIEIYQQEYWLKECNEYKERIDLICDKSFSIIEGIGFILFKELQKYVSILKVKLVNNHIHISFYKNDEWFDKYEDINRIIYELSLKYKY